jgi:hypothetical protein
VQVSVCQFLNYAQGLWPSSLKKTQELLGFPYNFVSNLVENKYKNECGQKKQLKESITT